MHEVGVVKRILKRALREARDGEAIARIEISLGELASYSPQALQFYFAGVAQGTPAAHAVLDVRTRETQLRCRDCGHTLPLTVGASTCPHCGGVLIAADLRDLQLEVVELRDTATGTVRRVALHTVVREEPHT